MGKTNNSLLNSIKKGVTPYIDLVTLISTSRTKQPFSVGLKPISDLKWMGGEPSWISLSKPEDYENAARFNPIVKSAINLLATASSNGRKVVVDIETGEVIPWTDKRPEIQKTYKLLVQRPNPWQSAKEFAFQGMFYLKTFGNRYIYVNMPIGFNKEIDILNVSTLVNLPSQFIDIKQTRKIYDQTTLKGIIDGYALTNEDPIRIFSPDEVLHFNEVNISSQSPQIMGIPKMESLKYPITNTQKAFEAMNTILVSRGMQGILSPEKSDGMGFNIPLRDDEKKEIDEKFKNYYGLTSGQTPFLISPVNLKYTKTIMSSSELGIYEEFSNNAILIGNEFGIPPELIKTYIKGATYENQVQSVRRLYQDTIEPMVEDNDSILSFRLNTAKYGFVIKTTFDHIPALQNSYKEKAIALNFSGRTAKDAYDRQSITRNEYREMIGLSTAKGLDEYKEDEVKQPPDRTNEVNEEGEQNEQ